jgi:hypothetical protein
MIHDSRQTALLWDTATLLLLLSFCRINRHVLIFNESEWNAFLSGQRLRNSTPFDVGLTQNQRSSDQWPHAPPLFHPHHPMPRARRDLYVTVV